MSVAYGAGLSGGRRRFVGRSGVAAALVLAAFTVLYVAADSLVRASASVERTYRVQVATARVLQGLTDAETAQRGFLLTRRTDYLAPYEDGRISARRALTDVQDLLGGKIDARDRLRELAPLVDAKLTELEATVSLAREDRWREALETVHGGSGAQAMDAIRMIVSALQAAETELLAGRERRASMTALVLFGCTIASAAMLAWLLWVTLSRLERDIENEVAHRRAVERESEEQRAAREEREWLLEELKHRVKNSLQQIAGILRLQLHDAGGRTAREALANALRRIMAIARVHERLYEGDGPGIVDAGDVVRSICDELSAMLPNGAGIVVDASHVKMPIGMSIPLMLIVNELVTNACLHAAGPDGSGGVHVALEERSEAWALTVSDSGPGVGAGVRDGLGVTLVKRLARQLDAELQTRDVRRGHVVQLLVPREAA